MSFYSPSVWLFLTILLLLGRAAWTVEPNDLNTYIGTLDNYYTSQSSAQPRAQPEALRQTQTQVNQVDEDIQQVMIQPEDDLRQLKQTSHQNLGVLRFSLNPEAPLNVRRANANAEVDAYTTAVGEETRTEDQKQEAVAGLLRKKYELIAEFASENPAQNPKVKPQAAALLKDLKSPGSQAQRRSAWSQTYKKIKKASAPQVQTTASIQASTLPAKRLNTPIVSEPPTIDSGAGSGSGSAGSGL